MNAQTFVDAIRREVMDASVLDTISIVLNPPGRSPSPELVEMSVWFNGLPEVEREKIKRMLEMVARHAVFGMLVVLDGARKVAPSSEGPEHFELRHVHGAQVDILCGPQGDLLHDLL